MATQIFKSFEDFKNRKDKGINGVSEDFALQNPDYADQNRYNSGCWNCKKCEYCKECFECENCESCTYCEECKNCEECDDCSICEGCTGCKNSLGCARCSICEECYQCTGCNGCENCKFCYECVYKKDESYIVVNENIYDKIPVIEKIHQRILAVTSVPGRLNMSTWHTCDTTHCRAGWVTNLSEGSGLFLEKITTPSFAAILIYEKSCPEIPIFRSKFFVENEEAFEDIKRCAEIEIELSK